VQDAVTNGPAKGDPKNPDIVYPVDYVRTNGTYDVVTGISTNVLSAVVLAKTPMGEEAKGVELLKTFWNNMWPSKIYKSWMFGFI